MRLRIGGKLLSYIISKSETLPIIMKHRFDISIQRRWAIVGHQAVFIDIEYEWNGLYAVLPYRKLELRCENTCGTEDPDDRSLRYESSEFVYEKGITSSEYPSEGYRLFRDRVTEFPVKLQMS